jgi:hypothetical protein
MIDKAYLDQIRARWEAVRDAGIEIVTDHGGRPRIMIRHGGGEVELCVTLDFWHGPFFVPADDGDLLFIGHLWADIRRLLDVLESGSPLPPDEAAAIETRMAAAGPSPWEPFVDMYPGLARRGVVGPPDFIRVGDGECEADMYLWMGPATRAWTDEVAPPAVFDFVGEGRQDLPALLMAAQLQSPAGSG